MKWLAGIFAAIMVCVVVYAVDQVMSAYLDRLDQKEAGAPIERMAINAFGATIADDLAIKFMTAENLSVLLKSGTVRNATENITFGTMSPLAELDISNIFVFAGRITLVKPVEFALRLGAGQDAGTVSMHFEGTTWELSDIELPPKVLANMVDRLPTP